MTTSTPNAANGPKVHVALVQLPAAMPDGKAPQVNRMREMVREAVKAGRDAGEVVDIVVLGEMWNGQPSHDELVKNAEPIPPIGAPEGSWPAEAKTCREMAEAARESRVWVLGGSIPEAADGKMYNTATVWSPDGTLVQTYRKTHLFDLCLPKMTYKESDTFGAGDRLAMFDTPFGRFGIAICYDIRFAELATIAARQGCTAMFYPAAFNTHTGPLHWELLQRARALDNQIYVATCSQARDPGAKYEVYGHSMAVSPMGEVIGTAQEKEAIVRVTFDPEVIASTRAGIPLLAQRRFDLYADVSAVLPTANGK
ncbi:hypothetical protein CspHIS471_0405730 [Cutaneotrichosporon sp. HIS471]|nr:hypothetical protein CspHIS471_0405730 [Cutaneotrichosporon sp. HIS471]